MIFCLSLDLDPLSCYESLYGLPRTPAGDERLLPLAIERYLGLTAELGIRGTLFAIGETLRDKATARALAEAARAGHEIGCHSFSHPYDLSHWERDRIAEEISRANRAIAEVVGATPVGFRAPGYLLGGRIVGVLESLGMLYDSSILPAPAYQGVKAAARAWLRLRGISSASAPAVLRESLAPGRPYRPHPLEPWRRGRARILELPIGTLLGVPLLGGWLALAGPGTARWLGALAAQKAYIHLELHAADLADVVSDGLPPPLAIQPDFKIPWPRKLKSLLAFARGLQESHRALKLEQLAKTLSDPGEMTAD